MIDCQGFLRHQGEPNGIDNDNVYSTVTFSMCDHEEFYSELHTPHLSIIIRFSERMSNVKSGRERHALYPIYDQGSTHSN